LLVLDNFEQVIDAGALVADLVAACPRLNVIVTSRIPLHLAAEHLFPIAPLPSPGATTHPDELVHNPAVTLFLQRALAVRPDLRFDESNAAIIAAIVRRLDGLPLAIELAAARVRFLSPQALLTRIQGSVGVLDSVRRDGPERHRTMRGAIGWSHDLLSPMEQVLFRRLAVFNGGIDLNAAAAVAGALGDVAPGFERRVEALVDHSLLQPQVDPTGEPRLLMLETIRDVAAEHLAASGEDTPAKAAHAAYFRAFAERHDRAGWVQYKPSLPLAFEAELPNLRAALTWFAETGDGESVQQMAGALRWFWSIRGYVPEGRKWLERGLADASPTSPQIRGRAVTALAQYAYFQGDEPLARQLFTEGLRLYNTVGDRLGQAFACSALGALARVRDDFSLADSFFERALALTVDADDIEVATSIAAATISNMAGTAYARGDLIRAGDLTDDALTRYRAIGYIRGVINNLHLSANIARDQRADAFALQHYQESLRLAHEYDDQRHMLVLIESIARIAATTGQPALAIRLFAAAATFRERTGYRVQDPTEPTSADSGIAAARAALTPQTFASTWAAGHDLSRDQAITAALAIVLPAVDSDRSLPSRITTLPTRSVAT
jgi:predicted ATPase